jgi:hypothetical protein
MKMFKGLTPTLIREIIIIFFVFLIILIIFSIMISKIA